MISVIVCTYNRDKYIYECLSRLAANRSTEQWELLLIDNNSTDSTASECHRFEQDCHPINYRYITEERQGLSYARNRGMQEAKGEWYIFLDDDAFVQPDYIQTLAEYISSMPDMHAFGGRIIPFYEAGSAPKWLCKWNRSWLSAIDKGDNVCLFNGTEYPIGANMGFKADMAHKCGIFNTTLGRTGKNLIGGEEKDYFNRLKALGANIYYLPALTVEHCIPPSRTTYEYISRLGAGIGSSEKLRTLDIGKSAYAKRLASEAVKWAGTICLAAIYTLQCRTECAKSLILFRAQVSKHLIEG
ncbi:MAG: glycosyltransferase family 2 protein [Paludibacteraceae bacterium]|nr:glycosyltransferase family 2 protein [Paludibacteraceae bacterium]